MTAAEALKAAMKLQNGHECEDGTIYFGSGGTVDPAALAAALKAAGYAVIELPTVAHKGPHDTDAKFFRQVARRIDDGFASGLGGSNVRRAVRQLLQRAADAAEADR